jgi:hypothetical protein
LEGCTFKNLKMSCSKLVFLSLFNSSHSGPMFMVKL